MIDIDFKHCKEGEFEIFGINSSEGYADTKIGVQIVITTPETGQIRLRFSREQAQDVMHCLGLTVMGDIDLANEKNVVKGEFNKPPKPAPLPKWKGPNDDGPKRA